jgi:hypothetical protein
MKEHDASSLNSIAETAGDFDKLDKAEEVLYMSVDVGRSRHGFSCLHSAPEKGAPKIL